MAKNYTIGEESRRFLDAFGSFQDFRNLYFDALCYLYGDDHGAFLYNEDGDKLDAVERSIMDYIRVCFAENMASNQDRQTVTI